jgi:hypothetical protein
MNTQNHNHLSRPFHSRFLNSFAALSLGLAVFPAGAAIRTVTNTADSGGGSLRNTIAAAVSGDIITFTNPLSGATILLTSGQLLLTNNLTIDASSLPSGIAIDGNAATRVFQVASTNTVVLDSLTITNGNASDFGGGIYNLGTLTVNRCRLVSNSASLYYGGGIYTYSGTLTVNQSTLTGNYAESYGGGIYNANGPGVVNNCTVAGNSAGYSGGGFANSGGPLTVNQSTLTGNSAPNTGGAIYCSFAALVVNQSTLTDNSAPNNGGGILSSGGSLSLSNSIVAANFSLYDPFRNIYGNFSGTNNLTTGNPQLAALGDYGGLTQTMLPLPGSPAIDGCTSGTSFTADQRGFTRISGPFADIGAAEYGGTVIIVPNAPVLTGLTLLGNGAFQFGFTGLTGTSFTVFASTNVALPLNLWSNLGPAVETPAASGQFQFTDPQATNHPMRYYRVTSP